MRSAKRDLAGDGRMPLKHKEVVAKIGEARLIIRKMTKSLERQGTQRWTSFGIFGKRRKAKGKAKRKIAERAVQLTDAEIARFLRANDFSPEEACKQIFEMLLWRRDHGVDAILGSNSEFVAQDKARSAYWAGEDLQGRPILVICARRHDPHLFSRDATIRFLLWKLEQKLIDPAVEEITLLIDLKAATRHNFDRELGTMLIPTLRRFYPGRLGLGLVYPLSAFNWLKWRYVATKLPDATARKFVFVEDARSVNDSWSMVGLAHLFGAFVNNSPVPPHGPTTKTERKLSDADEDVEMTQEEMSALPRTRTFQDFVSLDNLEKRFGGTRDEDEWDMSDYNDLVDKFDVDKVEYTKFMDAQDERLDALVRVASSRSDSVGSSGSASQSAVSSTSLDLAANAGNQAASKKRLRVFGSDTKYAEASVALKDAKIINAWSKIEASRFSLRCGPDYRRHKKKTTSESAIYDLVSVDIIGSTHKEFHIASRTKLPTFKASTIENKSGLPEMLVVSCQIPMYEPTNPVFGKYKTDGKTTALNAVFRLSDWAKQSPEHVSVQLFHRFVNCFELDTFRERLKCITSIVNPDDFKLSRVERALNSRYNNTPWLVRPQYQFFHGPGYFEIDIDIHEFAYFSRKIGWTILKRMDSAVLDCCLVIQAETDEEMPERALCCWRTNRFQLNNPPLEH